LQESAFIGSHVIELENLVGHVWHVAFSKKYPESHEKHDTGSQRLQPVNLLEHVLQVLFSRK